MAWNRSPDGALLFSPAAGGGGIVSFETPLPGEESLGISLSADRDNKAVGAG